MPSRPDCSAVPGVTAAVWKRKYAIFCAALRLSTLLPPAGWGPKLLACLPKSGSRPTSLSCGDTRLRPPILSHDHPRYERAFSADAPSARQESRHLARPATSNIGMDHFGDCF